MMLNDKDSDDPGVFPEERPAEWVLTHLVFRNLLARGGEVHRVVEATLEAKTDGVSSYVWRVPLSKPGQTGIYGLTIKDSSGSTLRYKISYLAEDGSEADKPNAHSAQINISFDNIPKGTTKTILIEYFIRDFADCTKRGFFKSCWRIDWIYHVHSHMEKFEYRVAMPSRSSIIGGGIESEALDDPFHFSFDEKEIVVWVEDDPPKGDLSGTIVYEQESPSANFLSSLASGTLIAALVTVVSGTHELWRIGAIFGVSIVGMLVAFLLTSRLLPTSR